MAGKKLTIGIFAICAVLLVELAIFDRETHPQKADAATPIAAPMNPGPSPLRFVVALQKNGVDYGYGVFSLMGPAEDESVYVADPTQKGRFVDVNISIEPPASSPEEHPGEHATIPKQYLMYRVHREQSAYHPTFHDGIVMGKVDIDRLPAKISLGTDGDLVISKRGH